VTFFQDYLMNRKFKVFEIEIFCKGSLVIIIIKLAINTTIT